MKPILFIPASKDPVRRLLRWCVGPDFWMTYRLPFQDSVKITYPDGIMNPEQWEVVNHEIHHAKDFSPWWGPFWICFLQIFPLPVLFSGRWFVERWAYLSDIKHQELSVEEAVETLWKEYGYCWPRFLMRKWFNNRLGV